MEEIKNIHWHDCKIETVVEIPNKGILIFNVQYPDNWDKNIFVPKSIIFKEYISQEVNEIPFMGSPTILDASIVKKENNYTTVKIETNAGYRLVTAKGVGISDQVNI